MRICRGSVRSLCLAMLAFALVAPIGGFGLVGCGSGIDLGNGSVTVTPPPVNVTTPAGTITFTPTPITVGPQGGASPTVAASPGSSPSPPPSGSPGGSPSPSPTASPVPGGSETEAPADPAPPPLVTFPGVPASPSPSPYATLQGSPVPPPPGPPAAWPQGSPGSY